MTDPRETGRSLAGRAESLPDATVPQRAGTIVKEFIGSIVEEAELRVQQVREEAGEDAAVERRAAYQSAKLVRERLDAVTRQLAELRAGIRRDSDALSTDPILTGSGLRGALPASDRGRADARPALGAPAEDSELGAESGEATSGEKSGGWWGKRRGQEPTPPAAEPDQPAEPAQPAEPDRAEAFEVPDSPEPAPASEAEESAEVAGVTPQQGAAEGPDARAEADSVDTVDQPDEAAVPASPEGAPAPSAQPPPEQDPVQPEIQQPAQEPNESPAGQTESPVATAERADEPAASREADAGAGVDGDDLSERLSRMTDVELAGTFREALGTTERQEAPDSDAARYWDTVARAVVGEAAGRPAFTAEAARRRGLVPSMVHWRRDRALATLRDAVRVAKRSR